MHFRNLTLSALAAYGVIALGFCFAAAPQAYAHQLEQNGSVAGVLHVDPDDDPYAGSPTHTIFYFQQGTDSLDMTQCDCTIVVTDGVRPLFSANTKDSIDLKVSGSVIEFYYTFPYRAVYTITVQGRPKPNTLFPSFDLTYNLRVDRDAAKPQAGKVLPQLDLSEFPTNKAANAGVAAAFVLVAGGLSYRDSQRKKKK